MMTEWVYYRHVSVKMFKVIKSRAFQVEQLRKLHRPINELNQKRSSTSPTVPVMATLHPLTHTIN